MTDITSSPPMRRRAPRRSSAEYRVYFFCIFFVAIPFAGVRWVRDVIRHRTLNLPGPLARAWLEADRITPTIFSV
jgi:hypothetical protein